MSDRTPCSRESLDPDVAALCRWLSDECGAEGLDDVHFGLFEHGAGKRIRGLGASRDIERGETFLCIPAKCVVSLDKIPERFARFVGPAGEPIPGRPCREDHVVALYMAEELAKESSFWKPYLGVLPNESAYSEFHPAYLHELNLGGGWRMIRDDAPTSFHIPDFLNRWQGWSGLLIRCMDDVEQALGVAGVPDAQNVYWAFVTQEGHGHSDGMIPLIDMANAGGSASNVATKTRKTDGASCLLAQKRIPSGSELLCADYPRRLASPWTFFMQYGFAFEPDEFCRPHIDSCWKDNWVTSEQACRALFVGGARPPAPEVDVVARNIWDFASVHCAEFLASQSPARSTTAASGVSALCLLAGLSVLALFRRCGFR